MGKKLKRPTHVSRVDASLDLCRVRNLRWRFRRLALLPSSSSKPAAATAAETSTTTSPVPTTTEAFMIMIPASTGPTVPASAVPVPVPVRSRRAVETSAVNVDVSKPTAAAAAATAVVRRRRPHRRSTVMMTEVITPPVSGKPTVRRRHRRHRWWWRSTTSTTVDVPAPVPDVALPALSLVSVSIVGVTSTRCAAASSVHRRWMKTRVGHCVDTRVKCVTSMRAHFAKSIASRRASWTSTTTTSLSSKRRQSSAARRVSSTTKMTQTSGADDESTTSSSSSVKTILGTMTFGWSYASTACDDETSKAMTRAFVDAGHGELDTALAYAGGETEKILGRILSADEGALRKRVVVDTKANPWPGGKMTSSAGRGGLAPGELRKQVERSVESLAGTKCRVLYLHAPDADTKLEDALRECDAMRREGLFEELGLSNFSAWETVKAHELSEKHGWKRPSIYQGMYNCLTRNVEPELIPALKATNMRFVAYNPLCGGLLTGKYKNRDVSSVSGGRFDGNDMYTSRFWLDCYHDAVDEIVRACERHGVSPADAALRWLYNHSELDGSKGDAVIIGASSVSQLESNLASAARSDPLPDDIVGAMDAGWERCRPASAPYFRGHCKI